MKKTKKEPPYILVFALSILLTLLIHYLFISNIKIPSTLHVAISLIILWTFLVITASITNKK